MMDIQLFEFFYCKVLDEFFVKQPIDSVLLFRASPILISELEIKCSRVGAQLHNSMTPMPHHHADTPI